MRQGHRLVILAAFVLLGLLVACRPEEPLPELWPMPSFTLTDQQGHPFPSSDLAGRATLLNFVYTHCPDICPTLSATMAAAQEQLRAEGLLGTRVELVSISVDPDRDTPAVLAEYAARFRADPDHWRFLTGEREAVYDVLVGFKIGSRELARAYAGQAVIPHSSRFIVVDPSGTVRATLAGDETSAEELVRTVKRTLAR
jgi:protein SCO1/2